MSYEPAPRDYPSKFDGRMRLWEFAAFGMFALIIWWPMAAAAFHR